MPSEATQRLSARIIEIAQVRRRFGYPDLQCAESPPEYLQRLRQERESKESKQRGGGAKGGLEDGDVS